MTYKYRYNQIFKFLLHVSRIKCHTRSTENTNQYHQSDFVINEFEVILNIDTLNPSHQSLQKLQINIHVNPVSHYIIYITTAYNTYYNCLSIEPFELLFQNHFYSFVRINRIAFHAA
jgi:hypothetical protein